MKISRKEYGHHFGPSEGDKVRLADTELIAEVEKDLISSGEELKLGGGKTMRDGQGVTPGVTQEEGALDMVYSNCTIIDPVLGIIKADIGIKDGKIAGIGNAGNPNIMEGVDENLIVGPGTDTRSCEGLIATPGGIDNHVHMDGANLPRTAIGSGITTMIGGGLGLVTVGICSSGKNGLRMMLQATEDWPINFGFIAKGNSSKPAALEEQTRWGACGFKIHEDWGATPSVLDTMLDVADNYDVSVQLHADTLNEMGYFEDMIEAINGRTMHYYHIEGAGGGHAPDIMRGVGESNILPSTTNPSIPYTINTFDEHIDMLMTCHHLDPSLPEDVSFIQSRVREETLAAEDVLHDMGAISMVNSDSHGCGRIGETITRTWQLADKNKRQRGPLPEDEGNGNDNFRTKRYIAKYTINNAITCGISDYVGSLEPGKMADFVLWDPKFFGVKPEAVIKGGDSAWGQLGEGNGSLMTIEPTEQRPQWGAHGKAKKENSVAFVSQAAVDNNIKEKYGLEKKVLPVKNTRNLNKGHMVHNGYAPDDINIDPETYKVYIGDEEITSEPAEELPLTRKYIDF